MKDNNSLVNNSIILGILTLSEIAMKSDFFKI